MAQLIDGYMVKIDDYGLDDRDNAHKGEDERIEKYAVLFNEEDAKRAIQNLIGKMDAHFDPMVTDRNVNHSFRRPGAIVWTSIDPKKDGYSYSVWYETCQILIP